MNDTPRCKLNKKTCLGYKDGYCISIENCIGKEDDMQEKQIATNKEIEEMMKTICPGYYVGCIINCCSSIMCRIKEDVNKLYNASYRKIPENAVVLTREEHENLCLNMQETEKQARTINDMNGQLIIENQTLKQAHKKTAREILSEIMRTTLYSDLKENGGKIIGHLVLPQEIEKLAKQYGVDLGE